MSVSSGSRKDDHVRLADAQHAAGRFDRPFDDVGFVHHACAAVDLDTVDLATDVLGAIWGQPFYINAMTGGSPRTGWINSALAEVAAATGTAIAGGSMSAYLKDPSTAPTFRTLRDHHPDGYLFANLSANFGPSDARRAVELIEADALQIHLNAVQEVVMTEGDTRFGHWLTTIESIAAILEIPVIVKEVGFGMSAKTARLLRDAGVSAVDAGGAGGTNFAAIEDARREAGAMFGYLHSWGQSTPVALIELDQADPGIPIIASGGVTNPLDVIRSLAFGAKAVGVSGHFLHTLISGGIDELHDEIVRWQTQLRALYGLLGAATTSGLLQTDLVITGRVREECLARGFDLSGYAARVRVPTEEGETADDND